MSGFKKLNLKKCYSSDIDDLLFDFYIPVLSEAVNYDRLAGFFSSSVLCISAKGIANFIHSGGKMRMIVCPRLNEKDVEAIIGSKEIYNFIEKIMLKEIEETENFFREEPVKALSWLIANQRLDIRVAIIYDTHGNILTANEIEKKGIFHQKVGILYDNYNNALSFSGSINESAQGWMENIEEFKVFRSWKEDEYDYFISDLNKFERMWNGLSKRVDVIEVPEAVKRKFIENAPDNIYSINWNEYYNQYRSRKIKLFSHQEEAVKKWLDNNMCGLFAMATGTGKTFASLGCLREFDKKNKKWICIIACPQNHLLNQWQREIEEFYINYDILLIADSTNRKWKDSLSNALMDIFLGQYNSLLVLTTHRTLCSKDFINIIKNYKKNTNIFLIADEVHGLGASKSKLALIPEYEYRLGLSATPKRWYDDYGTKVIYDYFKEEIYEFSIEKALNTINPSTGRTYLTPYRYIPKFVHLTDEEIEEYIEKTKSIIRKLNMLENTEEKNGIFEKLLIQRANIVKNAFEKYKSLNEILDEIKKPIKSTIIFCSPQQIDEVMKILAKREIIAHRFTENEGVYPERKYGGLSERDYLLKNFSEGKYQILAAIKCLDEGIDVPNAHTAILMSSSTNPREYIQRIGRVIRRYPGKEEAFIYDIIVVPSLTNIPLEWIEIEKRIFEKELVRAKEIAKNAINNAEALKNIYGAIKL